jgi:hypothetical protein
MNTPLFSLVHDWLPSLVQDVKRHLRQWTRPDNHDLVLNSAQDLTRSKPELLLENRLLRQQLIVLKRQAKRPALTWDDLTSPRFAFLRTLNSRADLHSGDSPSRIQEQAGAQDK